MCFNVREESSLSSVTVALHKSSPILREEQGHARLTHVGSMYASILVACNYLNLNSYRSGTPDHKLDGDFVAKKRKEKKGDLYSNKLVLVLL